MLILNLKLITDKLSCTHNYELDNKRANSCIMLMIAYNFGIIVTLRYIYIYISTNIFNSN